MIDPVVWALTTGEAGLRAQAMGLARLLSSRAEEKLCGLTGAWRWVPPLLAHHSLRGLDPAGDLLAPPWPDVLVSCGRRSGLLSIAIRHASGGRTLTVHVQDPQAWPGRFDLVAAMSHDRIRGPNVIRSATALHAVTAPRLALARHGWADRFSALPRPLTGVLVGGSTRRHPFSVAHANRLADGLLALSDAGHGLALTASRRTPPEALAALQARLQGRKTFFWDGEGDNPYLAVLGLADQLVVTGDSFSMISEALSTGAPVSVFDFGGGRRQRAFLEGLLVTNAVQQFDGRAGLPPHRRPVDANVRVAEAVRDLLTRRQRGR